MGTVENASTAQRRVWKWQLELQSEATVLRMPKGAQVISAGAQADRIVIWAVVDVASFGDEDRRFLVVPTGYRSVPDGARFVGTALLMAGTFVVHVFEVLP